MKHSERERLLDKVSPLIHGLIGKQEFEELVETFTDAERIEVREYLTRYGVEYLPRNLYFNYKTQVWIV